MAKEKQEKTNAVRLLERAGIPFEAISYDCPEFLDGVSVAERLDLPREQVFKTLVTFGKSGGHYVFVLPVAAELDRKKAAAAVGEKSLDLLPLKELFPLTGYVRGGCTAIGMKKRFPTVIDSSAKNFTFLYVSGGKLGIQLRLNPEDLRRACEGKFADLTLARKEPGAGGMVLSSKGEWQTPVPKN